MGAVQNYLNPITFEAKLFTDSLNTALSSNLKILDAELIEALEHVINTIDIFLEKSNGEAIVPTSATKLINAEDFKNIRRIYHCTRCKADLGKSAAKVVLHLSEGCAVREGAVAKSNVRNEAVTESEKKQQKEERKEKRKQKKEQRLVQAVVLRKKARAFLAMEQTALYQLLSDSIQIGDKLKCIPDYDIIENDLLELTKPLFPNQSIKVYKFGSRVSGIGTRDSDLDIFIDIGEIFKTYENRASTTTLAKLNKMRNALKNRTKSWKCLVVVDKARVPILKIIHAKTSIECDINFSNSLGHVNTLLMDYIFSLQPIARLMCIYMKKWLNRMGLKGDFSTYSMNLMVIFYLQILNHLPALSKIFDNVNMETALIIGPWLGTYVPLTLKDLNIELVDTSKLLTCIDGFLRFYSAFDYQNLVICPYQGTSVKKVDLHKVMPSRYTTYVANDKDLEIELKRPMTVQDPIQLNHNVTKGLSDFNLQVFKEFMTKSWQSISQIKR